MVPIHCPDGDTTIASIPTVRGPAGGPIIFRPVVLQLLKMNKIRFT